MITNKNDCWSEQNYTHLLKQTNKHLWRFIQHNSSVVSAEDVFLGIANVSKSDLQKLSYLYFILDEEVEKFIDKTAPSILKRLSKTSLTENKVLRGNIKGKINWSKTLSNRNAAGGDPSIFVCSQRSSIFDLPENRLLLFLLRRIMFICSSLTNSDFEKDETKLGELEEKEKWIDTVFRIGIKTNKLLKNPFVRKIGDMHDITHKTIFQAERVRGQTYSQLAKVAQTYYLMVNNPIDYLDIVLQGKTLEPLNKDTLYEIAVLFKLFETIKDNGWIEKKIALIGGGSTLVSRFTLGNKELKIYFQGIPKEFSLNSKYGPLMNLYGMSDRLRRPDLVLEVLEGNKKNFYIIEVKRSDKRTYLVDGAYKLFGYLKDFESIKNPNVNLYGILVGWSNIQKLEMVTESEIYLSSWSNLENIYDFIIKKEMR
ncbi:hypothetical protein SAMN05518871_109146 [Psychrobacillus sp. OK028]|uniref:hypothetical protein n=1 Tax=Psychrobacillus sp. OK028 TaxID=1884359 RepID=UPI00087F0FF7|nr:hypothetical protein [Psychrobacillus sp. OK028]SDO02941.1 hypothetical protein SAMN05518871_109146 [Psychrobacillus sp. OK028]